MRVYEYINVIGIALHMALEKDEDRNSPGQNDIHRVQMPSLLMLLGPVLIVAYLYIITMIASIGALFNVYVN